MTPPCVLVVDDSPADRLLLRHMIGDLPVTLAEAASVEEGLSALRECRPAALVLDARLGYQDGYQLLEHVRADPGLRSVKVVLHTAGEVEGAEAERAALADRIVRKRWQSPDEGPEIRQVLASLLGL